MRLNKKIFLLQLSTVGEGFGGIRTYVETLKKLYESAGYSAIIVGVGKSGTSRGCFDILLDYENILSIAEQYPCIITFGDYKRFQKLILEVGKRAGCPLIVHDPNEMAEYLKEYAGTLITLRGRNRDYILNTYGLDSRLLRMPHANRIVGEVKKDKIEKSLSMFTIYFRKHPEIIIDAIKNHNVDIDFYGTFNSGSRMTEFAVLKPKFPDWRNYYRGEFHGDKIEFISQYKFFIDMTSIKNHGGFQYTNLECYSAGTPIIIHKKFYEQDGYDHIDGVNCLTASNGAGLKELIPSVDVDTYASLIDRGFEEARKHHIDNEEVREMYLGLLK